MAKLKNIDKVKFEKLFGMDSGYVISFTNRTFSSFVADSVGLNIYDEKYNNQSGSKANRLRAFWEKESNATVGKLLLDLLDYWKEDLRIQDIEISPVEHKLYETCLTTAEKIKNDATVINSPFISKTFDEDANFIILSESIRENIEKNQLQLGIDRLHTFLMHFVRKLNDKYKIVYTEKIPLHSLFGAYLKHVKSSGIIESEMTERILRSSISILESFNQVRNKKSFAHANKVLNYEECLLIFNNICSLIHFVENIENEHYKNNNN